MKYLKKFKVGDENWEVLRFTENFPYIKNNAFIKDHKLENIELPNLLSDNPFFNTENTFDVAIMFSGGLDSLSLTLRHLEKGEKVALLSLAFNKDENIAASLTVEILKSLFNDQVKIFYLFNELYFSGTESSAGLVQQPFAAFLATFMPDCVKKSAKSLEIAYCMNDDAISYLTELKNIYNNAFKCKCVSTQSTFPKINFPLIKTKHFENLDYIRAFENTHDIIFPTFSAEGCNTKLYKKNNSLVYSIVTDDKNSANKENKKCPYKGYIIKTSANSYFDGFNIKA